MGRCRFNERIEEKRRGWVPDDPFSRASYSLQGSALAGNVLARGPELLGVLECLLRILSASELRERPRASELSGREVWLHGEDSIVSREGRRSIFLRHRDAREP